MSLAKQKVSFVFRSKGLQRKMECFCITSLFLENEAQIDKNSYKTMLFMSKSQSAKN